MIFSGSFYTCLTSIAFVIATFLAFQKTWFSANNESTFLLKQKQYRLRSDSSSSQNQVLRLKNESTNDTLSDKRTAPYELDTTQYEIDTGKMMQNWFIAQKLLNLDDNDEYNVTKHHQHIVNWNLNSQAKSNSIYQSLDLSVNYIAKVASEEVAANLEGWVDEKKSSKKISESEPKDICRVAFVRDPLARFISGYVEFEWRFVQAQEQYRTSAADNDRKKFTFHHYSLGSKERAIAFIHDLVSFRLLDWLIALGKDEGPPPRISWFDEHVEENPWLYHRVGITHICPMAGRLRDQKFDFIGQLEYMDRDWNLMSQVCDLEEEPSPFDTSLINHITSTDPHNTKCAMRVALQEDECRLKKAVCLLLSADYEILSNHFPYTSCSLDCSNQ